MSRIDFEVNCTPEYNSDRTLDGSSDDNVFRSLGVERSELGTEFKAMDRTSNDDVKSNASLLIAKSEAEAFSELDRLCRFCSSALPYRI